MQDARRLSSGDVYPSAVVPMLAQHETPLFARWGYERFDKKGLLINAQAETATQKPTFRKDFFERRCLIPANGFYEWTEENKKFFSAAKTIFRSCSAESSAMKRAAKPLSLFLQKKPRRPLTPFTTESRLWLNQTILKSGSAIFLSLPISSPCRADSRYFLLQSKSFFQCKQNFQPCVCFDIRRSPQAQRNHGNRLFTQSVIVPRR